MSQTEGAHEETPAPGLYTLDPARTTARFTTRHFFGLGAVRGTFALAEGQVRVAAAAEESTVNAAFASGSFASGNATRDKAVRSAVYLDAAAHPLVVFTSQSLHRTDEGHVLRGTVTVKDVTGPVEVAFGSPSRIDGGWRFEATTRIDRYAFGLTAQKGVTGRHLDLTFDAYLVPAPGTDG